MNNVFFDLNVVVITVTFIAIMYLLMFQKVWKVNSDGNVMETLKPGRYHICVFGRITNQVAQKATVNLKTASGEVPEVSFNYIVSGGMANMKVFSKFASFRLTVPTSVTVNVGNLYSNDIRSSQLLIKRLLFYSRNKGVEIVIASQLPYAKIFILMLINVGAFCFLFLGK